MIEKGEERDWIGWKDKEMEGEMEMVIPWLLIGVGFLWLTWRFVGMVDDGKESKLKSV
jgi:hypothetical protein